MPTNSQNVVLDSSLSFILFFKCRQSLCCGGTGKSIWCFERVIHLLSLLFPVSDINRMAFGTVRRQLGLV
jgi:hypothetical protein